VPLSDDLERAAEAAAAYGEPGERLEAVLAAEPSPGRRFYLCAFEERGGKPQSRTWLVLRADGSVVTDRKTIREAASIAALVEVAADSAGGGDLEALRSELVSLRLTENPPGIDEAEEAALALERAVGAPPRVATPQFLDDVGAATRRLEQALGEDDSPFGKTLAAARDAVEALTDEVEARYKRELDDRPS
jgi:hypothetical protein